MFILVTRMKIRIIHIGKTSSEQLSGFIDEFLKRSGRYAQVDILAIDTPKTKKSVPAVVKKQEGEKILKKLESSDRVILLDEKGKEMDSKTFASMVDNHFLHSGQRLVFIIGGAYGFCEQMYDRADRKLALSRMTFNHELALAIFTEQIYRALTIIKGHPYHNQ